VNVSDGKWLPPLNAGMKNTIIKGKVFPVKVSIGCGTTSVNGLTPAIQVLKGDVTPGTEVGTDAVETLSAASADTSGFMRQAGDGSYIYNLLAPNVSKTEPYTIRVRPYGDSNPAAAMYILVEVKAK
jgi:hypothetical protein